MADSAFNIPKAYILNEKDGLIQALQQMAHELTRKIGTLTRHHVVGVNANMITAETERVDKTFLGVKTGKIIERVKEPIKVQVMMGNICGNCPNGTMKKDTMRAIATILSERSEIKVGGWGFEVFDSFPLRPEQTPFASKGNIPASTTAGSASSCAAARNWDFMPERPALTNRSRAALEAVYGKLGR